MGRILPSQICTTRRAGGGEVTDFQKELEALINKHSIENRVDMPDFLLAEMICRFIDAVGEPVKRTLDWHGCNSVCHPKITEIAND